LTSGDSEAKVLESVKSAAAGPLGVLKLASA
jgi:hypothetical protein